MNTKDKIFYFDEENTNLNKKNNSIKNIYNKYSEDYDYDYDEIIKKFSNFESILSTLCKDFNFEGTILDLGCGSGFFGKKLLEKSSKINIIGVDLSENMANLSIQNGYNKVYVGLMENFIFKENIEFDHIISISSMFLLPNNVFKNVLEKLFRIAKKSITLEIEEITEKYNENISNAGYSYMGGYNNIPIINNT